MGGAGSVSLSTITMECVYGSVRFLCEGGIGTWLGGMVNVVDV